MYNNVYMQSRTTLTLVPLSGNVTSLDMPDRSRVQRFQNDSISTGTGILYVHFNNNRSSTLTQGSVMNQDSSSHSGHKLIGLTYSRAPAPPTKKERGSGRCTYFRFRLFLWNVRYKLMSYHVTCTYYPNRTAFHNDNATPI
jgi:hypothetical protein